VTLKRDDGRHRTATPRRTFHSLRVKRFIMRGILLWALGIPIPIIILLYLFHVI
jgi:hypothetical protein